MSPSSAGPERAASPSNGPPPPLNRGDSETVAQARKYFSPRKRFRRVLLSLSSARSKRKDGRDQDRREREAQREPEFLPTMESAALDAGLVQLNDELQDRLPDADSPAYQWAILYENQRGATFFSTSSYSSQTLLPLDPPPFSLPTSKPSRRVWRAQPTISLASYPLPDGTWRWVSRAWMIDMRGDGQVQHDGFEYAWSFRSRHWRPEVGFLSAGGWVRRRRWVRLMTRATGKHGEQERAGQGNLRADAERAGREVEGEREEGGRQTGIAATSQMVHEELGATRPPSVVSTEDDEDKEEEAEEVWAGDEGDWKRCHDALRRLDRDGRKLELWKRWFGFGFHEEQEEAQSPSIAAHYRGEDSSNVMDGKGKTKSRQEAISSLSLSDSFLEKDLAIETGVYPVEAPKEHISAVIRSHGSEILRSFVYPDSRAQFLEILDTANLLAELKVGMGVSESAQILDFWSYEHRLEGIGDESASPRPQDGETTC